MREFTGHQQDAVACCFLNNVASENKLCALPQPLPAPRRRPSQLTAAPPLPLVVCRFATASKDETIRVWDSVTGAVLCERRDTGSGAFTDLVETHAGG